MTTTACIESDRPRGRDGYARVKHDGRRIGHHRLVYAQHNGISLDEMEGRVVMHLCDNPPCVNPEHLQLGTGLDNAHDRDAKNRTSRGETHTPAKLTDRQVIAIRSDGRPARSIASDYGVSVSTIDSIRQMRSWTHLAQPANAPGREIDHREIVEYAIRYCISRNTYAFEDGLTLAETYWSTLAPSTQRDVIRRAPSVRPSLDSWPTIQAACRTYERKS